MYLFIEEVFNDANNKVLRIQIQLVSSSFVTKLERNNWIIFMVIIFLLSLVGLFLVLTSCLSFLGLVFRMFLFIIASFYVLHVTRTLVCFWSYASCLWAYCFDGFSFFAIKICVFWLDFLFVNMVLEHKLFGEKIEKDLKLEKI
jgi:hypothetical protein